MPLVPINNNLSVKLKPKPKLGLSLKNIPTNNIVHKIDNYSNKYDYVIEGNKLYISDKGLDDYFDYSGNEELKYLLLKFLNEKYNLVGYDDKEQELYSLLKKKYNKLKEPKKVFEEKYKYKDGKYYRLTQDGLNWFLVELRDDGFFYWKLPNGLLVRSYKKYKPVSKNSSNNKTKLVPKIPLVYNPSITGVSTQIISPESLTIKNPGDIGQVWNYFINGNVKDAYKLAWNGLKRKFSMFKGSDEQISDLKLSNPIDPASKFAIRPLSETGDTITNFLGKISDSLYIIPESILVNDYKLKSRNRNDNTPIDTEGAIITAFHEFVPFGKQDNKYKTFIGVDTEGNIKVGDISSFQEGDVLSGTYSNDIESIMKDLNLNYILHTVKTYPKYDYPAYTLWNNGKLVPKPEGRALNMFIRKGDVKGLTYGEITGGRVLVKVGDELRLLSGSLDNINEQFELMKTRNKVKYGTFYAIDNGSYNKALRTKDKHLSSELLHDYDMLNSTSGGNFLYIVSKKPQIPQFRSDTVLTPNIRTINSDSYKLGHDTINKLKGIVLHHTGFEDGDLTNVTNYLTTPGGNSAHVIIGYDGTRKVLAEPDKVTFHAGQSVWNNVDNVNDFMLGIEFLGDTNKRDLTPLLIQSAIEYMEPIIRKNNIKLENITTHLKVRDLWLDYAKKQGQNTSLVETKVDINLNNYEKIINALLLKVYYEK